MKRISAEHLQPGREDLRSGTALKGIVARAGRQGVDLEPGCAYGAVTRQMVDDLAIELREIKARLNQLFYLIAGAIALDVLLRLAGLR